jgi:seryl-tRNA synthetase
LHRLPSPAAEHPLQNQGRERDDFVHTLNGTAIAISRAMIAVLENNQQADGSVLIPEPLQAWVGKEKIEPKSD